MIDTIVSSYAASVPIPIVSDRGAESAARTALRLLPVRVQPGALAQARDVSSGQNESLPGRDQRDAARLEERVPIPRGRQCAVAPADDQAPLRCLFSALQAPRGSPDVQVEAFAPPVVHSAPSIRIRCESRDSEAAKDRGGQSRIPPSDRGSVAHVDRVTELSGSILHQCPGEGRRGTTVCLGTDPGPDGGDRPRAETVCHPLDGRDCRQPPVPQDLAPATQSAATTALPETKGSQNRNKAKIAVAKCHRTIADQRSDFLHQLSSRLVRENQAIAVESLCVANMVKNHTLAQAIEDAAWGMFVSFLEYKCRWAGKTLIKIGRFDPSTKTCSVCGHRHGSLTLADRVWTCPDCGTHHDRDLNAAINIRDFALAGQDLPVEPVDSLTPVSRMKQEAPSFTVG